MLGQERYVLVFIHQEAHAYHAKRTAPCFYQAGGEQFACSLHYQLVGRHDGRRSVPCPDYNTCTVYGVYGWLVFGCDLIRMTNSVPLIQANQSRHESASTAVLGEVLTCL
jgi:hypothetical protein